MRSAGQGETTAEQLQIVPPDEREHGDALFDLLGKVFCDGMGYYEARNFFRDVYIRNSHYDWRAARVGMIGGRVVSHWGVWGYDMRVGTARVRCGGVGAVATDGDLRRRGLMDRTAQAALAGMREQGYDVTMLFGIDNFYDRYGYVRAWSDTDFVVRVGDLPKEAPTVRPRKFDPRPRADLMVLYNRSYAATTGTAVRPTYRKRSNPWHRMSVGYLWMDRAGRPSGYVMLNRRGNRLACGEYCGDAEQALRVLGMLGRRWNCEEVRFETLPWQSELVRRLRRGNCRAETRYRRNGWAMVHLLNLPAAVGKLTGELSRRLRASALADWEGDLLIAGPAEWAMLSIAKGRVKAGPREPTRHRISGGEEIAQFLIGTDDPEEVVEAGKVRLSGDARRLIQVLFPAQWPQLCAADRY